MHRQQRLIELGELVFSLGADLGGRFHDRQRLLDSGDHVGAQFDVDLDGNPDHPWLFPDNNDSDGERFQQHVVLRFECDQHVDLVSDAYCIETQMCQGPGGTDCEHFSFRCASIAACDGTPDCTCFLSYTASGFLDVCTPQSGAGYQQGFCCPEVGDIYCLWTGA